MKKQFVTPRVIQEVQIQLEKDLLGKSVEENAKALILGHEYEDHDLSYVNDDVSTYWE